MLDVNCILGLVKDVALMVFCQKLYQAKEIVVFDSQKFTFKFVFLGFFSFLFFVCFYMYNGEPEKVKTCNSKGCGN